MKIVAENGTVWLPLASLAGKLGTCTSDWREKEHGQEEVRTYRISLKLERDLWINTPNANLCAFGEVSDCDFEWLQDCHGSGSRVIQKVPHTCLQKMWLCRRLGNCDSNLPKVSRFTTIALNECVQLQGPSNTLHTRAQKLLIASGGKPLLLRAVRVKSRGSSQSLQTGEKNDSI